MPIRIDQHTGDPAMNRHLPRAGFTLIELLVTVSIISILMLITIPVIHMVRIGSQTAVCNSNIRQCGIALMTYGADWDGRIDARVGGGHFGNAGSWEETLLNEGFFTKHSDLYASGGLATDCPTSHGPDMGRSVANSYLGHFMANDLPEGSGGTAPYGPSSDPDYSGHLRTLAGGRVGDAMLMEYSRAEWVFGYSFWPYGNHWDGHDRPQSLAVFWWDGHVSRAHDNRGQIYGFYEVWVPLFITE